MDTRMYWHNFITGEDEFIETPTDFSSYIPQESAAQNMYRLLVEDMSESPINAVVRVLEAAVGVKKD